MEIGSDSGREFPEPDEAVETDFSAFTFNGGATMTADGKGVVARAGEPNTPRSKHSAMEQRRRSKINDRFQILRDLMPQNDQKRDKASFLLEVIEYIRYLQEKVHKYETMQPGWNQDNKLMAWNNSQGPGDMTTILKNGTATSGYTYSGKFDEHPLATEMLPSTQNPIESEICAGVQPNLYPSIGDESNYAHPMHRITDADNQAPHPHWLRPSCLADCTISGDTIIDEEDLIVDEGTISYSNAYSDGVLNSLTKAMQNSGVDLSQASMSVQINFGKRPFRSTDPVTKSNFKAICGDPLPGHHPGPGAPCQHRETGAKR